MKVSSLFKVVLLCMTNYACHPNITDRSTSPLEKKVNSAILMMYKIYSDCSTKILKNLNGKIDTLDNGISYLCLPLTVNDIEVKHDTTIISLFFSPADGYIVEDTKCKFAYGIGFVGQDEECDFIEFGDNYYSKNIEQYKTENRDLDSIFFERTKKSDCINDILGGILNNK